MFKLFLSLAYTGFCLSTFAAGNGIESLATESVAGWHVAMNAQMQAQSRYLAETSKVESWRRAELIRPSQQSRVFLEEAASHLRLKFRQSDGSFGWTHFQLGYGDVFPLNTVTITRSNGSAWEEPNCAYVKYCRNF